jgi:hypothetical protein
MWATLAGASQFPDAGALLITNSASKLCPAGWSGIVAIGDAILATAPNDVVAGRLEPVLRDLPPSGDWSGAFVDAVAVRGPAQLAYLDRMANDSVDERVEPARVDDDLVAAFFARVPKRDLEEAGIDACTSLLACIRRDDRIVAAAGYRVWLDAIAHMSVVVDPQYRGQRLATSAATSATKHALGDGLIAQWRAQPAASKAAARKLGYVPLGQQVSVKL